MRLGEENVLKEIAYAKGGRRGITLSENSSEFIMAEKEVMDNKDEKLQKPLHSTLNTSGIYPTGHRK